MYGPRLTLKPKLVKREEDMNFILDDEDRNRQCQDLEKRFATRFPGLSLEWSEPDRNGREVQKFRLFDSLSLKKLRLVFISNESFEDETVSAFLNKFEDFLETIAGKDPGDLLFKNGRLSIKEPNPS